MRVLISGGAGFIGQKLSLSLTQSGHQVTVLDALTAQVHGAGATLPAALRGVVQFVHGDVRQRDDWRRGLANQDAVVHLAAETGTGQSMYEIARYSDVNIGGTAQLLDILANEEHCVSRIVVASSRSIYGEGQYHCSACGVVYPEARSSVAMKSGDFSVRCPRCGEPATLMPTSEDALIHPASLYGITKATQEQMITTLCPALGITPVALRLQNVYGPGQSLSNPYTGILSIFSTRIRNGSGLNVFEDGAESRDFVYVDDVVSAATGALERPEAIGGVFNIGSGVATTLLDVAHELVAAFGNVVPVAVSGQFRAGDIRHNVADISRARAVLGFSPRVSFASGIRRFVDWVQAQAPVADLYDRSISEMKAKGLIS